MNSRYVNWMESSIIEAKPSGWKAMPDGATSFNWSAIFLQLWGFAFSLSSTDDDWVASPVPGRTAKTDKVIPGFEFGKVHSRSESRRAVLNLSIARGGRQRVARAFCNLNLVRTLSASKGSWMVSASGSR